MNQKLIYLKWWLFFLLFEYPGSQNLYIWLQLMITSVTWLFIHLLNKPFNKMCFSSWEALVMGLQNQMGEDITTFKFLGQVWQIDK